MANKHQTTYCNHKTTFKLKSSEKDFSKPFYPKIMILPLLGLRFVQEIKIISKYRDCNL